MSTISIIPFYLLQLLPLFTAVKSQANRRTDATFQDDSAASFRDGGSCTCSGSVAATVVITTIVALVLGMLWWCYSRRKAKKIGSKADQEAATKAGYDNPQFQYDEFDNPREDEQKVTPMSTSQSTQPNISTSLRPSAKVTTTTATSTTSTLERGKSTLEKVISAFLGSGRASHPKRSKDDMYSVSKQVTVPLQGHDFTGLGFTVDGSLKEGLFVKKVMNRGPASQSGQVLPGDRVIGVTVLTNHIVLEDALTILSYASPYPVLLHLEKSQNVKMSPQNSKGKMTLAQASLTQLHHPAFKSQSLEDINMIKMFDIEKLKIGTIVPMAALSKIKAINQSSETPKLQNERLIQRCDETRHSERAIDVPGVDVRSKANEIKEVPQDSTELTSVQVHRAMSTSVEIDMGDEVTKESDSDCNKDAEKLESNDVLLLDKPDRKTKFGVKVLPDIGFLIKKNKDKDLDIEAGDVESNQYGKNYSENQSFTAESNVKYQNLSKQESHTCDDDENEHDIDMTEIRKDLEVDNDKKTKKLKHSVKMAIGDLNLPSFGFRIGHKEGKGTNDNKNENRSCSLKASGTQSQLDTNVSSKSDEPDCQSKIAQDADHGNGQKCTDSETEDEDSKKDTERDAKKKYSKYGFKFEAPDFTLPSFAIKRKKSKELSSEDEQTSHEIRVVSVSENDDCGPKTQAATQQNTQEKDTTEVDQEISQNEERKVKDKSVFSYKFKGREFVFPTFSMKSEINGKEEGFQKEFESENDIQLTKITDTTTDVSKDLHKEDNSIKLMHQEKSAKKGKFSLNFKTPEVMHSLNFLGKKKEGKYEISPMNLAKEVEEVAGDKSISIIPPKSEDAYLQTVEKEITDEPENSELELSNLHVNIEDTDNSQTPMPLDVDIKPQSSIDEKCNDFEFKHWSDKDIEINEPDFEINGLVTKLEIKANIEPDGVEEHKPMETGIEHAPKFDFRMNMPEFSLSEFASDAEQNSISLASTHMSNGKLQVDLRAKGQSLNDADTSLSPEISYSLPDELKVEATKGDVDLQIPSLSSPDLGFEDDKSKLNRNEGMDFDIRYDSDISAKLPSSSWTLEKKQISLDSNLPDTDYEFVDDEVSDDLNITDATKKKRFGIKTDIDSAFIQQLDNIDETAQKNQSDEMKSLNLKYKAPIAFQADKHLYPNNLKTLDEACNVDNLQLKLPRAKIPTMKSQFQIDDTSVVDSGFSDQAESRFSLKDILHNSLSNNLYADDYKHQTFNNESDERKMRAGDLDESLKLENEIPEDDRHLEFDVNDPNFIIPDFKTIENYPIDCFDIDDSIFKITNDMTSNSASRCPETPKIAVNSESKEQNERLSKPLNFHVDYSIDAESDLPEADSDLKKGSMDFPTDISQENEFQNETTNNFGLAFGFQGFKNHIQIEGLDIASKSEYPEEVLNKSNTSEDLPEADFYLGRKERAFAPEEEGSQNLTERSFGKLSSEDESKAILEESKGFIKISDHEEKYGSNVEYPQIEEYPESKDEGGGSKPRYGLNFGFKKGHLKTNDSETADHEEQNISVNDRTLGENVKGSKGKSLKLGLKGLKSLKGKIQNELNKMRHDSPSSDDEENCRVDEGEKRKKVLKKKEKEKKLKCQPEECLNNSDVVAITSAAQAAKDNRRKRMGSKTSSSSSDSSSELEDKSSEVKKKKKSKTKRREEGIVTAGVKEMDVPQHKESKQIKENVSSSVRSVSMDFPNLENDCNHVTVIQSEPDVNNAQKQADTKGNLEMRLSPRKYVVVKEMKLKSSPPTLDYSSEEVTEVIQKTNNIHSIHNNDRNCAYWGSDSDMEKQLNSGATSSETSINIDPRKPKLLTDSEEMKRRAASLGDLSSLYDGCSAGTLLERAVSLDLKNATVGPPSLHIRRLQLPDSSATSIDEVDESPIVSSPAKKEIGGLKAASQWGTLEEALRLGVNSNASQMHGSSTESTSIVASTFIHDSVTDEGAPISNIEITGDSVPIVTTLSVTNSEWTETPAISSTSAKTTITVKDLGLANMPLLNDSSADSKIIVPVDGSKSLHNINDSGNIKIHLNSSYAKKSLDPLLFIETPEIAHTSNSNVVKEELNPADDRMVSLTVVSSEAYSPDFLQQSPPIPTKPKGSNPLSSHSQLVAIDATTVSVRREETKENGEVSMEVTGQNYTEDLPSLDPNPHKSMTQIMLGSDGGYTVTDGTFSRTVIISSPACDNLSPVNIVQTEIDSGLSPHYDLYNRE